MMTFGQKEDIIDYANNAKTLFISDELIKIAWSDGAKISCIRDPKTMEESSMFNQKWAIDITFKCGRKRTSDISFAEMVKHIGAVNTIAEMTMKDKSFVPSAWS